MITYGYDSERRRFERARREEMRRISKGPRARARQDAADAARTRRRCYETLIVLVAAALIIIGWDHARGPVHLPRPVDGTSSPHPNQHP